MLNQISQSEKLTVWAISTTCIIDMLGHAQTTSKETLILKPSLALALCLLTLQVLHTGAKMEMRGNQTKRTLLKNQIRGSLSKLITLKPQQPNTDRRESQL